MFIIFPPVHSPWEVTSSAKYNRFQRAFIFLHSTLGNTPKSCLFAKLRGTSDRNSLPYYIKATILIKLMRRNGN